MTPHQHEQLVIRLASAIVETMPEIPIERAKALARVWTQQVRRVQVRDESRKTA
jgi:hypothetical protein